MNNYAIITGDIVSSRKIAPKIREELYNALDSFVNSLKPQRISAYERFRGDSIQCTATEGKTALRTACLIRCFVLAYVPESKRKKTNSKGYSYAQFDIRLAIGMGSIDFVHETELSRSDGEAFEKSGSALDSLKGKSERMTILAEDTTAEQRMGHHYYPHGRHSAKMDTKRGGTGAPQIAGHKR